MLHFGTGWVDAWPMSLNTNECIGRQAARKDHEGQSHGQRGDTMDKGQLMIIPFYKVLQAMTSTELVQSTSRQLGKLRT